MRASEPDVVEDLDGPATASPPVPAGPDGRRQPRQPRRAVALAAAVVVAVVAGSGVHSASLERARHRLDRAVASLAVSVPAGATGPVGAPDAGGWSPYQVSIPLFQRGGDAVSVTVLGLDTPHQRTLEAAPAVRVAAGAPATSTLGLQVRCRDVPPPNAPATGEAARTAVRARVDVPGGSRVVRLRLSPALHAADPLVQQLWVACAYAGQLPAGQLARGRGGIIEG